MLDNLSHVTESNPPTFSLLPTLRLRPSITLDSRTTSSLSTMVRPSPISCLILSAKLLRRSVWFPATCCRMILKQNILIWMIMSSQYFEVQQIMQQAITECSLCNVVDLRFINIGSLANQRNISVFNIVNWWFHNIEHWNICTSSFSNPTHISS